MSMEVNKLCKGDVLGSGGYGKVYSATSEDGKRYAVKRIFTENPNDKFIESLREADIATRFPHPHLINTKIQWGSAFDGPLSPNKEGKKDDSISFIMEIAKGDTKSYNDGRPFSINDIRIFATHCLLGLEYLHHHGVTHQDIKTQNILCCSTQHGNMFKISDMGLAYWNNRYGYKSPVISTSWYRAPEILRGRMDYGTKVDIWSLGCVVFELIFNRPLLYKVNSNDNAIIYAELKKHIPNVSQSTLVTWNTFWTNNTTNLKDDVINYRSFLEHMLDADPYTRWSASSLLAHPFLNSMRGHIDLIHQHFPLFYPTYYPKTIESTPERIFCTEFAVDIMKNRADLISDNCRTLFHTMRLVEDYIQNQIDLNQPKYSYATKFNGIYWSKDGTYVRFMTCFFIMNKYLSLLKFPIPIEHLFGEKYATKNNMTLAIDVEKYVVNQIYRYNIYSDTILDLAGKKNISLTDQQIKRIFIFYTSHRWLNLTLDQILEHCLNSLNKTKQTSSHR